MQRIIGETASLTLVWCEDGLGRRVALAEPFERGRHVPVVEAIAVLARTKTEARTVIDALRNVIGDLPEAS